jgi:Holliday junction resolvasome RuvABC DNA-binding subunit
MKEKRCCGSPAGQTLQLSPLSVKVITANDLATIIVTKFMIIYELFGFKSVPNRTTFNSLISE